MSEEETDTTIDRDIDPDKVRMTAYSHGSGCGCKLSPAVLSEILEGSILMPDNKKLLVGNHTRDDAAVYDMGHDQVLISTTDFFMPIVDSAYDFGRIAAANAISDIYAMGGSPVLALSILGWPLGKIPTNVASRVMDGARSICLEAGVSLAGGHSIDSPEPIFGLAVSGIGKKENIKRNDGAREGDLLFLTKPLGIGILSTAEKKGILEERHLGLATSWMLRLNKIGERLAEIKEVHAMTDVTGFGLFGHLSEVCVGSNLSCRLDAAKVCRLAGVDSYLQLGASPGGAERNWQSYGDRIECADESTRKLFCDPQTSGGLLFSLAPSAVDGIKKLFSEEGLDEFVQPIACMESRIEGGALVYTV